MNPRLLTIDLFDWTIAIAIGPRSRVHACAHVGCGCLEKKSPVKGGGGE